MHKPYVFFDVSQTLLEKRLLYETMFSLLQRYGYKKSLHHLKQTHSMLSETFVFPDNTDELFYQNFNAYLLQKLDIEPTKAVLRLLYDVCHRLPWVPYSDTSILQEFPFPKGIISNWDKTLPRKLQTILPYSFFPIIVSGIEGVAKPEIKLFQMACANAHRAPVECWYIGDSITRDIEPASQIGMHAILIDRYNINPTFTGVRVRSLLELQSCIEQLPT